jgi:hypothetical protein
MMTDIPLPSDMIQETPDPFVGIPNGSTPQESRSVLKDKTVISSPPRSLSALPAFRMQVRKSAPVDKCVASKRTLSRAEIVKKLKRMHETTLIKKFILTIERRLL